MYRIGEAAKISKVTLRTLRHYDRMGLLVPQKDASGYRRYSDEDLDTLQSILYFRYLGFPLNEIKTLLEAGAHDRLGMLRRQREMLEKERTRLDRLIETLDRTMEEMQGEKTMTSEEKFSGFDWEEERKYEAEARSLYGDETIDESLRRQKGKEQTAADDFNRVFARLAENRAAGTDASAPENLDLAEELLRCIRRYGFDCSVEVFGRIGAGYSANPEFKRNIDRFGEGTARYASDVVAAYVAAR